MCDPITITAMTLTAASGGVTAYGQYKEGVAQSKYYQYQADQSRMEGNLAVDRADRQSNLIQDTASQEGKKLKTNQAEFNASQKVALATQGVTGVNAENIVSDAAYKQNLDEQALRYNYDTKSYEVRESGKYQKYAADVQADQYGYASKSAKKAGKLAAITTLLGTAASVAGMGMGAGGAAKT